MLEAHNAVVVEHLSAAEPCLHRGLLHAALCLNDVGFAVLYDNHTAMRVAREGAELNGSALVGLGDVENDISVLGFVGGIADHEVRRAHHEEGSQS